ncbi:MAG TPA: tetratricopeptide repeat protein [Sedimentisphaerales bacterium]|nr:tetratricopeptide repeat protein [Sedimentisphaerales bacterium]
MDITEEGSDFALSRKMAFEQNIIEECAPTQHYEVLQELGDCYTSVGDYAKAQNCYEKATSLGPDEPAPYVGLGVVSLQKNLLDEAEIAFRVACRLDVNCAKAYAGLAMVAQQRADYERAFDMYLKCLELNCDNPIALLGLFQTSCQMGSFAKVIYYLEVYLNMHPGDTSVMFSLAALYMKDGRFDQARKVLLDVLALDPANRDAANLLEEVEHNVARMGHRAGAQIG